MSNRIKMIVCDLDGTLLNDHKIISQNTLEKMIAYQQQGYLLTLASGRYYREVERFAKELKLDEYHGYAVCGNGFEIVDVANQTAFHFSTIPCEIARECVILAKKCHLMQYIKINGTYHLSMGKHFMKIIQQGCHQLNKKGVRQLTYAAHLLDETIFEKDLFKLIQKGIVKICVIGTPSRQKRWIGMLEERYPDTFSYYPVNSVSLEITHKSVSKKHAVEVIANKNGFSLNEVIAFGDSGNDEPLLLNAGIGITMKNGTKRALKKAKIISEYTNHEDGVIRECEKYLE
ncbi:Cof-type HAD-IIB family hydrolase [uncultured Traorella sp.]|uniref:Cof-type HAD-IIB family hydrolase n=1 Tax=uncultured Traorella sp. TaxID=1929048 RepID=UPI0025FE1ACE|nr:Cof-type HAD-IIB family hydrolase [uncultured Traorella sp.]